MSEFATTYGEQLLSISDQVVIGTAMLGNQFGTVKNAMVKRTGDREEIKNQRGELRIVLIKNPGFELMLECAFEKSVSPPGLLEQITLPFIGVVGYVMEGVTIKWEQGNERGLMIPVSNWDAMEDATAYRLLPSTGAQMLILPYVEAAPSLSFAFIRSGGGAVDFRNPPDDILITGTRVANALVDGYEIQRSTNADMSGATTYNLPLAGNENQALPWTLKNLGYQPDTLYYFRARGKNHSGPGPWSEIYSIRTWPQSIFGMAFNSETDVLTWSLPNVAGSTHQGFVISREANGVWNTVATLAADVFSYDLTADIELWQPSTTSLRYWLHAYRGSLTGSGDGFYPPPIITTELVLPAADPETPWLPPTITHMRMTGTRVGNSVASGSNTGYEFQFSANADFSADGSHPASGNVNNVNNAHHANNTNPALPWKTAALTITRKDSLHYFRARAKTSGAPGLWSKAVSIQTQPVNVSVSYNAGILSWALAPAAAPHAPIGPRTHTGFVIYRFANKPSTGYTDFAFVDEVDAATLSLDIAADITAAIAAAGGEEGLELSYGVVAFREEGETKMGGQGQTTPVL
jgi:hypothetical protein